MIRVNNSSISPSPRIHNNNIGQRTSVTRQIHSLQPFVFDRYISSSSRIRCQFQPNLCAVRVTEGSLQKTVNTTSGHQTPVSLRRTWRLDVSTWLSLAFGLLSAHFTHSNFRCSMPNPTFWLANSSPSTPRTCRYQLPTIVMCLTAQYGSSQGVPLISVRGR